MAEKDFRNAGMRTLEAFTKNCVDESPGAEIDKEEFYGALIHYCEDKKLFFPTKDFVNKNLQMFLPDVRSSHWKFGNAIKPSWQNVKLKQK
jgi:hypothetical protein